MVTRRTRRLITTAICLVATVLGARGLLGRGQANAVAGPADLALLRSRLSLVSRVHPQTGVTIAEGTLDPVTPPRWGDEAASHLPRSLHLVVPGAHGVGGQCLEGIQRRFLDAGSLDGLDVSCSKDLRPARFQMAPIR